VFISPLFTISFYFRQSLDGFIEEDHDEAATGATHSRHLDLDRRRREVEDMDDEQMADFYDKKYGGRNRVQSFKGSAEDVPQQLLLPSVNDPNLWMIKCKVCMHPLRVNWYKA
jgi:transcription elongation factor SPT5